MRWIVWTSLVTSLLLLPGAASADPLPYGFGRRVLASIRGARGKAMMRMNAGTFEVPLSRGGSAHLEVPAGTSAEVSFDVHPDGTLRSAQMTFARPLTVKNGLWTANELRGLMGNRQPGFLSRVVSSAINPLVTVQSIALQARGQGDSAVIEPTIHGQVRFMGMTMSLPKLALSPATLPPASLGRLAAGLSGKVSTLPPNLFQVLRKIPASIEADVGGTMMPGILGAPGHRPVQVEGTLRATVEGSALRLAGSSLKVSGEKVTGHLDLSGELHFTP